MQAHGHFGDRARLLGVLDAVGLESAFLERYPHALSGGQRQRVGIARALALEPRLLVCDEPVSALDVSVQAQILTLPRELRARTGLTLLLVSRDLAVVEHLADRVAVLQRGRIVEEGPREQVLRMPRHPYTRALLDAEPTIGTDTTAGR